MKERKRGKKEKKGKEKEREERRSAASSSDRSEFVRSRIKARLLNEGYALLQEVEILPPLVISTLKDVWLCFMP